MIFPHRREKNAHQPRQGLTLADTLSALVMVAVLMVFLADGVQGVTQSAAEKRSMAKCKELGSAMQSYAATRRGLLPASGVWKVAGDGRPTSRTMRQEWTKLDKPNADHLLYSWGVQLLPYVGEEKIYNDWNKDVSYLDDKTPLQKGGPTNLKLSGHEVKAFLDPADKTLEHNKGNLSYVCNGGFCFHPLVGASDATAVREISNLRKMGLMFLDSNKRSFVSQNIHRLSNWSTKVLFAENVNTGVGKGPGGWQGGWACPHPYNTSFFINGSAVGIPQGPYDYSKANTQSTKAPPNGKGPGGGINSAIEGGLEQKFPYPNGISKKYLLITYLAGQPGKISADLDPAVWARMVCPLGNKIVNPKTGAIVKEKEDGTGGYTQRPLNEGDIR